MRKLFGLLLVLTMMLAACSSGGGGEGAPQPAPETGQETTPETGQEAVPETPQGPDSLSIATGGTSGTYYPIGGGMAQIFTDHAVNTTAEATGASVENMQLLKAGDVDLAFVQSDIADYAASGMYMFEQSGPVENIQALASLYNETIQIVVPGNSDIRSVEDLAGKRVSIGAPGSGTELNALQILEVHGMTEEDLGQVQRLDFGNSTSYIQDGSLDAAFVTAGTPTSAVSELAATAGTRIVNIADDKIAALLEKYPYYAEQTVEAGTYSGFDETVKTVAVKAQLVVSSELSEALVYDLTKSLFDNLEQLAAVHAKASEIKAESALEGISLELHPGAAKYFEEAGIK